MNKSLIFLLALCLFFIPGVLATTSSPCILNVALVNQDPSPALPGSYVNVLFQVSGVTTNCNDGARFEIIPAFPFSLDDNSSLKVLSKNTWVSSDNYNTAWTIPYKLRVNKDALDGDTPIEVRYADGADSQSYITQYFNITVQDTRTMFDAVLQETSGSDVSIAIANVGKYTANSVVVRIPEQEDYSASGTDGQMVGNLASGDYTIVGFTLAQKSSTPQSPGAFNATRGASPTPAAPMPSTTVSTTKQLKFDIYYTDNIGQRREVNMTLSVNSGNNSSTFTGGMPGQSTTWYSSWTVWAIILAVLIVVSFLIRYFLKKNKTSSDSDSSKTPSWVKNAKDKEKK